MPVLRNPGGGCSCSPWQACHRSSGLNSHISTANSESVACTVTQGHAYALADWLIDVCKQNDEIAPRRALQDVRLTRSPDALGLLRNIRSSIPERDFHTISTPGNLFHARQTRQGTSEIIIDRSRLSLTIYVPGSSPGRGRAKATQNTQERAALCALG